MAINEIVIIGCGPGSRACVTEEACDAVKNAEVLIGAQRLLDLFPESNAVRIVARGRLEDAVHAVTHHCAASVAVLVTGDPGVASLAQGILKHFGRENCRVISGISSVQMAFARLGLSWMDARIVNAHSAEPTVAIGNLARENKIAVLAGSQRTAAWIIALAETLGAKWRIFVAQNLTLQSECVREVNCAELREKGIPAQCVLILARRELL